MKIDLKPMVVNILMSGEAQKVKPFTVGSTTLYPSYYQALGARISMFDSVEIVFTGSSGQARYKPEKNKMYLGFQSATPYRKSLVIHEATHAVCDMIKAPITFGDGEVMAFVAQSVYFKANNAHMILTSESDDLMADILYESNKVADTILGGGSPTNASYEAVRQKIALHSDYNKMSSVMGNFYGLNDEE